MLPMRPHPCAQGGHTPITSRPYPCSLWGHTPALQKGTPLFPWRPRPCTPAGHTPALQGHTPISHFPSACSSSICLMLHREHEGRKQQETLRF